MLNKRNNELIERTSNSSINIDIKDILIKKQSPRRKYSDDFEVQNNNLNIIQRFINVIKRDKIELSNKFLSIFLHIFIMIVFEIYFYFEYAIPIEKEKFLSKITNYFNDLQELNLNTIEYYALKNIFINRTSKYLEILHQNYLKTHEIQQELLEKLLIKSIQMASIIGGILFVLFINGLMNKKDIKWKWIVAENLLMFFILGVFEYFFFMNIILKYDPVSDDDIKYEMARGFMNYLNNTSY
jgi:hypothetical protein